MNERGAQKLGLSFHGFHWIILPPVRTVSVKYQKDS